MKAFGMAGRPRFAIQNLGLGFSCFEFFRAPKTARAASACTEATPAIGYVLRCG